MLLLDGVEDSGGVVLVWDAQQDVKGFLADGRVAVGEIVEDELSGLLVVRLQG